MKEKTRCAIEEMLDSIIKSDKVDRIKWINREFPVRSMRDLVLGHLIGELTTRTLFLLNLSEKRDFTDQDEKDTSSMIKRRLPELVEKIEKELNR
ncbi:MAG: hypothetical protein JSW29_01580 [Candidatus Bathyarchaeota archaeon]|nr:MAG: hypothetical protein JSW29_01580 [Candidatus Bathyarchaeota archaeon]